MTDDSRDGPAGSAPAAPEAGADGPSGAPSLSVVVASRRSRDLLEACLASLLPQCRELGAELVVVRPEDLDGAADLRTVDPPVRFRSAPPGSGVPELRGRGLEAARGDVVALTEDHCLAAPDWLDRLAAGHERGADVVGGRMDNARRGALRDWGAFFAEYGFFAGDRERDASMLTGANVSYGPRVLGTVEAMSLDGEWENVIHAALAADGRRSRFTPDAVVYHNRSWSVADFCGDRFRHGRAYARRRLRDAGASVARWAYLAGTPLLPVLLAARIGRTVPASLRGPFVASLPATLLFLTAWAVGELVGYLEGASGGERTDG